MTNPLRNAIDRQQAREVRGNLVAKGLIRKPRRRYINGTFQCLYEAILTNARNPSSEMYLADGSQHTGAGHRCAFWNGFNGTGRAPVRGTMSFVCYMAGKDFAKEQA